MPTKAKATTKFEKPKASTQEAEVVTSREIIGQPAFDTEKYDTSKPNEILIGGLSTADLQQALQTQTEQRSIVKKFVKEHLEDGTDFGRIHVVNRDKCSKGNLCDRDYHFSKAVLFKPGQEKLFSLFQITSKLVRDEETYEMLPEARDLVAYKCIMYRNGIEVGEGRGSAAVGENGRNANSTIKIAEKRARMDACLSLGFSEYFAQDLDDPDYKGAAEMANQRVAAEAERRDKDEFGLFPRDPQLPVDNNERIVLQRIILKNGFSDRDETLELLRINGITDPANMTSGQARDMMSKLAHSLFAAPPPRPPAPEPLPAEPEPEFPTAELPGEPLDLHIEDDEPQFVIDDELKNNVMQQAGSLGLTPRGDMWLYQQICGRPFAKWNKMTDKEWRKAFDFIMGILDQRIDVPEEYIAGLVPADPLPDPDARTESKTDIENIQSVIPGAEVLDGQE